MHHQVKMMFVLDLLQLWFLFANSIPTTNLYVVMYINEHHIMTLWHCTWSHHNSISLSSKFFVPSIWGTELSICANTSKVNQTLQCLWFALSCSTNWVVIQQHQALFIPLSMQHLISFFSFIFNNINLLYDADKEYSYIWHMYMQEYFYSYK